MQHAEARRDDRLQVEKIGGRTRESDQDYSRFYGEAAAIGEHEAEEGAENHGVGDRVEQAEGVRELESLEGWPQSIRSKRLQHRHDG